jgi:hypothetical protein
MNEIDDILNSPEYFHCSKASCKLRLQVCLDRQNENVNKGFRKPFPHPICLGCKQGEYNLTISKERAGKMAPENQSTEDTKPKVRICETCNEKKTISPNVPYCPSCMAKRSNAKRKVAKKTPYTAKTGKKAQHRGNGKGGNGRPDTSVVVDFSIHMSILKTIETMAEEEVRPLESQIIYILKMHIQNKGDKYLTT